MSLTKFFGAFAPAKWGQVERLRKALNDCVEHMEWSTPQGEAAYQEAKLLLTSMEKSK